MPLALDFCERLQHQVKPLCCRRIRASIWEADFGCEGSRMPSITHRSAGTAGWPPPRIEPLDRPSRKAHGYPHSGSLQRPLRGGKHESSQNRSSGLRASPCAGGGKRPALDGRQPPVGMAMSRSAPHSAGWRMTKCATGPCRAAGRHARDNRRPPCCPH